MLLQWTQVPQTLPAAEGNKINALRNIEFCIKWGQTVRSHMLKTTGWPRAGFNPRPTPVWCTPPPSKWIKDDNKSKSVQALLLQSFINQTINKFQNWVVRCPVHRLYPPVKHDIIRYDNKSISSKLYLTGWDEAGLSPLIRPSSTYLVHCTASLYKSNFTPIIIFYK